MQTINFITGEGYEIISFPDGEKHLKLTNINRKESVEIITRIKSSDDLFILMQLSDILKRNEIVVYSITIPYLMGMRNDRVISFEQPYTLKIIVDVIKSFNCNRIFIHRPHSLKCQYFLDSCSLEYIFDEFDERYITYCFPDKGAYDWYKHRFISMDNILICQKQRCLNTGKLSGFMLLDYNFTPNDTIMVIDDLCDGGGTFIGIHDLLRKEFPLNKICLSVTHAIQKQGIEKVASVYDEVNITNSYHNWEDEELPKNVSVIDVLYL